MVFQGSEPYSAFSSDPKRETRSDVNCDGGDHVDETSLETNDVSASQSPSCFPKGDALQTQPGCTKEKVYVLSLKNEFYETTNGTVVVRLQPRPSSQNSVNVEFFDQGFVVEFCTNDAKFLAAYDNSSNETPFVWNCRLIEPIVTEQCKARVQGLIEITLKKRDPSKKWQTLQALTEHSNPLSISSDSETICAESSSLDDIFSPAVHVDTSMKSMEYDVEDSRNQSLAVAVSPSSKPMCKVQPYKEPGITVPLGWTGLRNFGNTCFINATLQALTNTRELRDYFLEKLYIPDINRTNPLGMKGRLARVFAQVMEEMWSGMTAVCEPAQLKELVGRKAIQFANYAQHDAQEFLAFLLDGLHEDLNRVGDSKPLTPTVECDGRPEKDVANEAWRYHLMRNDSFIVDLFHGQLKSRLDCPACGHTSITFDPFVYLPVPFPRSSRPFTFYYWPVHHYAKPIKYTINLYEDLATVDDLLNRIGEITNVKPAQLRLIEIFHQKIFRRFRPEDLIRQIGPTERMFVFQVHDPEEVGENVVELAVVQRKLCPRIPQSSHCSSCGKEKKQLRACTRCRTASYCDVQCQKLDWPTHKTVCRPPSPELVGQPFLVSLPASMTTWNRLIQILEARARHTVDVFQPPVTNKPSAEGVPMDLDSKSDDVLSQSFERGDTEFKDCDDNLPAKRIRIVFGEPNGQALSTPLFQLALSNESGEYSFNDKKLLECDSGDEPINFPDSSVGLAMDWINENPKGSEYLLIVTKAEIDCDAQLSSNMADGDQSTVQLHQLFDRFTETEVLSAADAWYCSKCREHRRARKTLQLWKLPSILIVQLKRFIYTSHIFRNKIDKHVVYPKKNFDVSAYVADGALGEQETHYDLYAVVCHLGTSLFGHYYAYARLANLEDGSKEDIEWRYFDDTEVRRAQEQAIQDSDAYFLFYRRKDNSNAKLLQAAKQKAAAGHP